ncbi:MAG: hypothetical protein WCC08_08000 [Terrimicrobiaceae bacterium]
MPRASNGCAGILLATGYRVHEITHQCRTAMHVDSSFVPLAPGKVLVNPDYVDPAKLPRMFNSWEILIAPRPDPPSPFGLALSSLIMQPLDQHKRAHGSIRSVSSSRPARRP